jgi:alkylation response protein AidB-like acyl-CoA dehydrogenase
LTGADAGSDAARMRTTATRDWDEYLLNGAEMFVTNGERGHVFAILAKTNPMAQPQHRGTSAFIVEKGLPGFRVGRKIKKLGYRGLDTCELIFEDCRVPKDRLIGREGEGFKYVLTALKIGRIDVAARGVGMARAAFEILFAMPNSVSSSASPFTTSRRFSSNWSIWRPRLKRPAF